MKTERIEEGYIAVAKDGRMLKNYWSGGSQTGTNKQSLTTDVATASVNKDPEVIKMYIYWFNTSHVNKIDFEIKKVKRVWTAELTIL